MRLVDKFFKVLEETGWVDKVEPKWHPPEGLFTKSPEEIAKTIAKASKDLKQAVARVNFFYNRYGCSGDRKNDEICKKKDKVLDLLHKYFNKDKSEAKGKILLTYDGKVYDLFLPNDKVKTFKSKEKLIKVLKELGMEDVDISILLSNAENNGYGEFKLIN